MEAEGPVCHLPHPTISWQCLHVQPYFCGRSLVCTHPDLEFGNEDPCGLTPLLLMSGPGRKNPGDPGIQEPLQRGLGIGEGSQSGQSRLENEEDFHGQAHKCRRASGRLLAQNKGAETHPQGLWRDPDIEGLTSSLALLGSVPSLRGVGRSEDIHGLPPLFQPTCP